MANTTVGKVREIAPHLSVLSDSTIEMLIEDARLELAGYQYDGMYQEKLERYLTAHLGTLSVPRVTSEQMDDLRKDYGQEASVFDKGLSRTVYGQEVLRILKKGKGPAFRVFS